MTDASFDGVLALARSGKPLPVHILVGEESFLVERLVRALRSAAVGQGVPGLNEDVFHADKAKASSVIATCRTLAMMSDRRFVLLRGADKLAADELDQLATYLEAPSPEACLVITAEKLDGRSRFVKAAKKRGALLEVQRPKGAGLAAFAQGEARARGHTLGPEATQHLLDALGDDLAALDDAIERLSLYVGPKAPIDTDAIDACIARVRTESIWMLVDALGMKDERKATRALTSLLHDDEPPLRILAMLARQMRLIAKMREALAEGLPPPEAAQKAGAPPWKARELVESARRFPLPELGRTFEVLGGLDRALKSSRLPDDVLMHEAVATLCRR